jgi:hypothetical protein
MPSSPGSADARELDSLLALAQIRIELTLSCVQQK